MTLRGRIDGGADVDPIDRDAVEMPAGVDRPVQEDRHGFGVMKTGHRDQNGQDQTERAGQDMTLDPPRLRGDKLLIFLLPSKPRGPF